MKLTGLLLLLTFFSCSLFSQNDYGPGYVVKKNQDTLKGYLQKSMEEDLSKTVKFKSDLNATEQVFSFADLQAFWVDEDFYRKISFQNTASENQAMDTAFGKQLVKGNYELYTFLRAERRFYVVKKDTLAYLLYNTLFDNRGEVIQDGNYSSRLVLLQRACEKPAFQNRSIEYGQREMTNYFIELNNCLVPGSATSLYHKSKIKTEILVFAGGMPLGNQNQFSAEAVLRFSSPRLNKGTVLNIGFHFSNTVTAYTPAPRYYMDTPKLVQTLHQVISVPLSIQYYFTNGRIRPYVYGGFSIAKLHETTETVALAEEGFQKGYGFAFLFGVGVEVRIVNRLFVKADYRYELLSQFPAIGVAYQIK